MIDNQEADAVAENTSEKEFTISDFIGLRSGQLTEEEQPEGEEPSLEESAEEPELASSEEVEPEAAEASEVDISSLTPEAIEQAILSLPTEKAKELGVVLGSRAVSRISQLTSEKRQLEEKLRLVSEQAPPAAIPASRENRFSNIESLDDLSKKADSLNKTIEVTSELLEEHKGYSEDDIIIVGGKEYTKSQIWQAHKDATKALLNDLPKQQNYLQEREHFLTVEAQYEEQALREVPEIGDEGSDIGKSFKELMESPVIGQLRAAIPALAAEVPIILAHYLKSSMGANEKAKAPRQPVKIKPGAPSNPSGIGAATSSARSEAGGKELKRFEDSGSLNDLIAARAAKHSNKI